MDAFQQDLRAQKLTCGQGMRKNSCFVFFRQDDSTEARVLRIQTNELVDSKYGFDRYKDPGDRLGWLINMHPVRYRSLHIQPFGVYT